MTSRVRLPQRVSLAGDLVLGLVSLVGLAAFFWPFVASPEAVAGHGQDAPWLFALLLALLGGVVIAEQSSGRLEAKTIAVLGVTAALGAGLRALSAGIAGLEPIFFLVILAARAMGARLAFLTGALTLLTSAFLTAGVGPWTVFQMIATGWVALLGALLPPVRGRAEVGMLALYGGLAGLIYGALMNLWFWPFSLDGGAGQGAAFTPGASVATNLGHYAVFYVATSLGYDLPRAVLTATLIAVAGRRMLLTYRRALRAADLARP